MRAGRQRALSAQVCCWLCSHCAVVLPAPRLRALPDLIVGGSPTDVTETGQGWSETNPRAGGTLYCLLELEKEKNFRKRCEREAGPALPSRSSSTPQVKGITNKVTALPLGPVEIIFYTSDVMKNSMVNNKFYHNFRNSNSHSVKSGY